MSPLQPASTLSRVVPRCLHKPSRSFRCERQPHPRPTLPSSRRALTTTSCRAYDASASASPSESRRRWAHTPERMTAPVSLKKHDPSNEYPVNASVGRLDDFYERFLGDGGHKLLSDEVKWLAVTHKSFDQGRRGYNDRLAFLGKRIVNLQTSLALLYRKDGTFVDPPDPHADEREPFRHPVIDLLPRLTEQSRLEVANSRRMANLGRRMGMLDVVRWKPRKATDLKLSGAEQVIAQAVYAIVGGVALQRGGEVANRIVKDRILSPLDLR